VWDIVQDKHLHTKILKGDLYIEREIKPENHAMFESMILIIIQRKDQDSYKYTIGKISGIESSMNVQAFQ